MYTTGNANPTPVKEAKTEEVVIKDAIWRYAPGCAIVQAGDKRVSVQWDNGHAFSTTKGGARDYVPAYMRIHVGKENKGHGFFEDYVSMVTGGVNPKLAFILCLMRKVVFSLGPVKLSLGEIVVIDDVARDAAIDDDVVTMLKDQGELVDAIVQQSYTVLCLNGISMVARGHHYQSDDNVWNRFITAVKLDETFAKIKAGKWEEKLFHDCMHPFDVEWLSEIVSDPNHVLIKKVHGIATTRWLSLPAGCTSISLTLALGDLIKFKNEELYSTLVKAIEQADDLKKVILKAPLDWNINYPRANTDANIRKVRNFEPIVAFMNGYLKALEELKVSAMQAKSLGNIRDRNPQYYILGTQAAETFKAQKVDPNQVTNTLKEVIGKIQKELA